MRVDIRHTLILHHFACDRPSIVPTGGKVLGIYEHQKVPMLIACVGRWVCIEPVG